jgi:flavin reductase (DIM6/NTAB) family NADH-FMN oxidoreductase RutF
VSARHEGVDNVMAAAWACALDFSPPKLTVVLDKTAKTRELVEMSGTFVIQIPTVDQLQLTHEVGTRSLFIGEVVGAWSGTRVFKDSHWHFESADPGWRSLHYIAGGSFYAIGDLLSVHGKLP